MTDEQATGSICWTDLTVENADSIRDFYSEVVGWQSSAIKMGDYEDYCMNEPESGQTVAGICHARGANANIPPQWLVYMTVADLDQSVARCQELGGEVLNGPRSVGDGTMVVIRDPAGAVAGLYQRNQ